MKSIPDPRYKDIIENLIELRKNKGITQTVLADRLDRQQSYVAKIENFERRMDLVELYDWLKGLDFEINEFISSIEWE